MRIHVPPAAFALAMAVCLSGLNAAPAAAETLYNGIVLPTPWPPQTNDLSHCYPNPNLPYYLASPPTVIPIDVGRQLLVDDFLIESTTLRRMHHLPQYYAGNPILRPQTVWEGVGGTYPSAMPFSDGVWWDPSDRVFKMWYLAGSGGAYTCLATSKDGLRWERPNLGVYPPNPNSNIINSPSPQRDSAMIWLDLAAADPSQRWRITYYHLAARNAMSADGINWYLTLPADDGVSWNKGHANSWDRTTFFYNPFRNKWVFSWRYHMSPVGRARKYTEQNDWAVRMDVLDPNWARWWSAADSQDLPDPRYGVATQLYNLDVAPYESLMLGFFSIWHGDCHVVSTNPLYSNPQAVYDRQHDRPKLNAVKMGYSRDGWYFHRPDRRPFLPYSESYGAWNYGNIQSAGGGPMVMGDRLYIYCSGRNWQLDLIDDPNWPHTSADPGEGEYAALAFLRRDGFASLDAALTPGELVTRKVTFAGRRLFVNVDDPQGELRVEVQDANGLAIAPFTLANCREVRADSTLYEVTWSGAEDLSALIGRPVRLRFQLTNGSLYAFWVSPDASGASYGYMGAGGPGYGPVAGSSAFRDAVGKAAYAAAYALNQVDAGPDCSITLPGAADLNGAVSIQGLPAGQNWSVTWSVTSGPGMVTFADPAAAHTTATFSAAGRYLLRLTIRDGWMTAYDEMIATVMGAGGNHPPMVDAGLNRLILWPANIIELAGAVSDDGLPASPSATVTGWSQVSGPGTVTFADPAAPATTATFSATGTYVLRLSAQDSELEASDTLIIQVASNGPPAVQAGPDASVALPTATVDLHATVSDDGLPNPPGALTTTWSLISGPGTVVFADSGSIETTASFSQIGLYVLRLTVDDSEMQTTDEITVTVEPQPNAAPTVDAGLSQTKAWPTQTVRLDAMVTDDGLPAGGTITQSWSCINGPGTVTFANAAAVDTTAMFSTTGTYVLRLTAGDSELTAYDDVTVTLLPTGADLAMRLMMDEGAGTTAADATGNGHPGTLVSGATWVSGHEGQAVHVSDTNRQHVSVNDFNYGPEFTVSFWFKLDNNSGPNDQYFFSHGGSAGGVSTLNILINETGGASNPNKIYTYMRDSDDLNFTTMPFTCPIDANWHLYTLTVRTGQGCKVYLDGALKNSDALYGGSTFTPSTAIYLGTNRSIEAVHSFRGGLDDVRLYVRALDEQEVAGLFMPDNFAPTVDAGPASQQVIWPGNALALDGTVSDDGLPNPPGALTTTWSEPSGPGTVTFANAGAIDTTATFSTVGTYVLRLTADDGLMACFDELTVVVCLPNERPAVNAGNDATITMPTDTYPLVGLVSDDGRPNPPGALTVRWTRQSGPDTVTLIDANAAQTMAQFPQVGTYVLRLWASDSELESGDEMTVTVRPAPNLRADFNHDNQVDGLDFLRWQSGYPAYSGATFEQGDANGDGAVDGLDFLEWQACYHP